MFAQRKIEFMHLPEDCTPERRARVVYRVDEASEFRSEVAVLVRTAARANPSVMGAYMVYEATVAACGGAS